MRVDIHRLDEEKNNHTRADEYQPSSTFINPHQHYQPHHPSHRLFFHPPRLLAFVAKYIDLCHLNYICMQDLVVHADL